MATRLKYNVGITINLGNYQSARVDIGVEQDVEVGETEDGVMDSIQGWCGEQLAAKVKQIKEDNNVK